MADEADISPSDFTLMFREMKCEGGSRNYAEEVRQLIGEEGIEKIVLSYDLKQFYSMQ